MHRLSLVIIFCFALIHLSNCSERSGVNEPVARSSHVLTKLVCPNGIDVADVSSLLHFTEVQKLILTEFLRWNTNEGNATGNQCPPWADIYRYPDYIQFRNALVTLLYDKGFYTSRSRSTVLGVRRTIVRAIKKFVVYQRTLVQPAPSPTPSPTPDPTPDPTPSPTPDPTPVPTPIPPPQPTPDPNPPPRVYNCGQIKRQLCDRSHDFCTRSCDLQKPCIGVGCGGTPFEQTARCYGSCHLSKANCYFSSLSHLLQNEFFEDYFGCQEESKQTCESAYGSYTDYCNTLSRWCSGFSFPCKSPQAYCYENAQRKVESCRFNYVR